MAVDLSNYFLVAEQHAICVNQPRFSLSLYTGKERDAESGLDYFGARYYGSNMGRFMSPDPVIITPERLPQKYEGLSTVSGLTQEKWIMGILTY